MGWGAAAALARSSALLTGPWDLVPVAGLACLALGPSKGLNGVEVVGVLEVLVANVPVLHG
eukprot:5255200-Alexandrium_andersonii.AAC.1